MKRLLSFAAVAVLFCLIPALAGAAETEKVHKSAAIGAGGTVKLNNFSGEVRIVGADVNEVTVDAVRTAPRDRLDHIKLDVRTEGTTVIIEANKKDDTWRFDNNNVVNTEMDVRVPKNVALLVKVFSSGVTVSGVSGEQSIETFSGKVRVADGPAKLRVKTFSGAVSLDMGRAASPDLRAETFSGAIDARVAENAKAGVEFDSFSGQLTSAFAMTIREQKKGRLLADINGGDPAHVVKLKTFSGDVKITK
jgi:DUF4097 and DUF4098 domain-containing protein YvlB